MKKKIIIVVSLVLVIAVVVFGLLPINISKNRKAKQERDKYKNYDYYKVNGKLILINSWMMDEVLWFIG